MGDELILGVGSQRCPVFDVQPVQLVRAAVRLAQQRLGVGGREAVGANDQRINVHAGHIQRAQKLEPLAVVTHDAGRQHVDPHRPQVVRDRAGRARLAAHPHDLVRLQPGLQRGLSQRVLDDQIFVQEEVPYDQDGQGRKAREEGGETVLVHWFAYLCARLGGEGERSVITSPHKPDSHSNT